MDKNGHLETDSVHDHKYLVTITEELSRFVSVEPTTFKANAAPSAFRFVRYFKKQSGKAVKKIYSDGGTYICRVVTSFVKQGVEL